MSHRVEVGVVVAALLARTGADVVHLAAVFDDVLEIVLVPVEVSEKRTEEIHKFHQQ